MEDSYMVWLGCRERIADLQSRQSSRLALGDWTREPVINHWPIAPLAQIVVIDGAIYREV